MKNRKMLASSLLAGALLSVGYVTSKPTEVHALTDMSVKDTQNPLKITLIQTAGGDTVDTLLVDLQRSSTTNDNTYLDFDIVNEDTGELASSHTFGRFGGSNRIRQGINIVLVKDGNYHLDIYSSGDFGKRYFGRSEVFRISRGEYYPIKKVETPTATETPKQTTNSSSGQTGWSGSSYYKAGVKVVNQWIFDVQYNSYFYLNSEGSYARNTWVGSYYLKSNGKMAKSEWVYDSSYSSYYYLTSEGSYARNTWVGDYYLKSNGKMAVNERTPDGYKVDGSGKWVK